MFFYYDPHVPESFNNQLHKLDTLEGLLKQVDILSIHCPLNEKTKNLLNKDTLSFLKKGAVIINTSRGKIIDEKSLITMLDPQELSLGLDVLANESSVPTELLKNERVILTPHSGFYTTAGLEKMRYLAIVSALNFLTGKENLNCIVNR